jgi:diaminopimelate decarboxylase
MNDLIRPTLYEAYHEIVPLKTSPKKSHRIVTDVVGPVCESGDYFTKDRLLPPFQRGDYLALLSAGAYGFTMASNYNTRPRPAEVMVSGNKAKLVRKRETLNDLIRGEKF